jgi:hypothetical protein
VLIRYALETDPRFDACADYAVRLLLEGIGVAGRRVEISGEPDLVYARSAPDRLGDRTLWIRAAEVADWNQPSPTVTWLGDMPVLGGAHSPSGDGAADGHVAEDIVYSAYAAVTGARERAAPKDSKGVPTGSGAEPLVERPVVAMYCRHLSAMLERRRGGALERVPLWPHGRTYAIVLSHDVDVPFTRAPWAFYTRRLVKDLRTPRLRAAVRGLMQMGKVAAVTRVGRRKSAADDPNFQFDAWIEFERSLPTSSCFYVAVTTSADTLGSPYDVNYEYRDPEVVAQLRRAVDAGWEVGLHASINARRLPGRISEERAMLEGVLGSPVRGVRHHHWALDPELPERTLWEHAHAGLRYDSSFGLNDAAAFRRGMIWPFQPFDTERGEELPILEIPPTMMDGSIFYRRVGAAEGRRLIGLHIGRARELGGAAVLDWHVEQMNPARLHGAGPALVSVLSGLVGDSDVYWAAPHQLADWWLERRKLIQSSA